MGFGPNPLPPSSGTDLLWGTMLLAFGVFFLWGAPVRESDTPPMRRIYSDPDAQRAFSSQLSALLGILWTAGGVAFFASILATVYAVSSAIFLLAAPALVVTGLAGWSYELLDRPATVAVLVAGIGSFFTAILMT